MASYLSLVLAALLVAAPAGAAQRANAPLLSGPVTPAVAAAWAGSLETYFKTPNAGTTVLAAVLANLRALDLSNPETRASVEPVALQLQAEAAKLLAAKSPRLSTLAALREASAVLPLPAEQTAAVQRLVENLSAKKLELLDARMKRIAVALSDVEQPAANDDVDPIVVMPQAPGTRVDSRIVILHVVEKNGMGKDQSKELKELAARYPGKIKILDRDSGSMYMSVSALQIAPSVRAIVEKELAAIEGLNVTPLADLAAAGLSRSGAENAADLDAVKKTLDEAGLVSRLTAFAGLASRFEQAAPADIAAIPQEKRDELMISVLQLTYDLTGAFDMVQQSVGNEVRRTEYEAREKKNEKLDYAALDKITNEIMARPEYRAKFGPLREVLVRALGVIDRLDTPDARVRILDRMREAEYAAFSLASSDEDRRLKYVKAWLEVVTGSVAETIVGLENGYTRDDKWSGSNRSGGYEHVSGRRQSTFLFQWRSYRVNPGDLRQLAVLLLGVPGPNLADLVVEALTSVQADVARLNALNRKWQVARDVEAGEKRLEGMLEQAKEQGMVAEEASVVAYREQILRQAEAEYDKHSVINGHGVVDNLINSLHYAPYYAYSVPGFKEAAYVATVLEIFEKSFARVTEQGMLAQLSDAAIGFLSSIMDRPLFADPALRARGIALWRTVSDVAARESIPLATRLDGVIDARPELKPTEPKPLEGDVDGSGWSTVWHTAESPDGKYLARAGGDRLIFVWDLATGKKILSIKLEDARQHYGDLDNSLGVAWTPEGKLIVATLHDKTKEEGGGLFQKLRVYDVPSAKADLLPGDELSQADLPGVAILRHMPLSAGGQYAAAELRRNRDDNGWSRWIGSDVSIWSLDGRKVAQIDEFMLLDAKADHVLGAHPHMLDPDLGVWNLSDPANPRDVTPRWMTDWVDAWTARRKKSEYGYWPSLSAALGAFAGHLAVLVHDEGKLQLLDFETGALKGAFEIPHEWRALSYATDEQGTRLAALVKAPGNQETQRLMVWDLRTGELVIERVVERLAQVSFTRDGKRVVGAGRGPVLLLDVP